MQHHTLAAAVAVMAVLAGAATAQTPVAPRPVTITNPDWASLPDVETLGAAHPAFASMAGIGGSAVLNCTARPDGGLTGCRVVEALPAGMGFDRAALSVAPDFRVTPRSVDGLATAATVQFRIHFTLAEDPPIAPWTGPEPGAEHLQKTRQGVLRFESDVEAEFEASLQDLGLDADRADTARALARQVHDEFTEKQIDASALALARLVTPEQLEMMMSGASFPPPPPEDLMMRAGDRVEAVSRQEEERLRTLYCARFACPPPVTPRAGFVLVD
jgi:TonB family protein